MIKVATKVKIVLKGTKYHFIFDGKISGRSNRSYDPLWSHWGQISNLVKSVQNCYYDSIFQRFAGVTMDYRGCFQITLHGMSYSLFVEELSKTVTTMWPYRSHNFCLSDLKFCHQMMFG